MSDSTSSLLLDADEIVRITGLVRKADQRRWLKAHGWKFEASALGWPVVSRKHAERMLDGEQDTNHDTIGFVEAKNASAAQKNRIT